MLLRGPVPVAGDLAAKEKSTAASKAKDTKGDFA